MLKNINLTLFLWLYGMITSFFSKLIKQYHSVQLRFKSKFKGKKKVIIRHSPVWKCIR